MKTLFVEISLNLKVTVIQVKKKILCSGCFCRFVTHVLMKIRLMVKKLFIEIILKLKVTMNQAKSKKFVLGIFPDL